MARGSSRKIPSARNVAPIRVGIIGAGGIAAKMHLPQLEKIPGVEIHTLAGRKVSRLQVLSKRHGGKIVTDYQAVIDDPEINAVIVATPHPHHVDWGIAALKAGKHVLMQKPLAPTLKEADRFVKAAEESKQITYCLPQLTFPAILTINELIAEGLLGKISGGHCRFSHGGPEVYYAGIRDLLNEPPPKPGEKLWFFEAGEAAVGALFDMGVYAIARLVAVLGEARSVMGMTAILDKPSEVEDTATLIIQFASGAIASAETGWCDGARTGRLGIHGTLGRVDFSGYFDAKLMLYQQASKKGDDVPAKQREVPCRYPYKDPHTQWVEAIRTNTLPPFESAKMARHITEIMLAGLESGKTGRRVELKTRL
ncbi:MAG TPA: Gfo/Idh/MocA family oxidoreductase [Planctomycetota bacterium]|nr:Gfo/Idh/MocA family oxidoreductase [Planctomycetota bacterium]